MKPLLRLAYFTILYLLLSHFSPANAARTLEQSNPIVFQISVAPPLPRGDITVETE